jgi:streptogramin lyase
LSVPLELQRHIINTLAGHEKAERLLWLCGAYLIVALSISTPTVQAGTLLSVLGYMLYTEPLLGLVVLLIAVPQVGGSFGAAVDADDNVWLTSYGGRAISKFDKNGKSLAGPDGITFNHQLGLMQGVIVTASSDVWVVGISKNQLVSIPKGEPANAELLCEGFKEEPCMSFAGPFHIGIDQQDRIWVTNAIGDFVTRFPAADPSKVEHFKTGLSGSGLGIDSKGNVWVTNRLASSASGAAAMVAVIKVAKEGGSAPGEAGAIQPVKVRPR